MSDRQLKYRGFRLTVNHSGWTRITVGSVYKDREFYELPDLLLDKHLSEAAFAQLDAHLQRHAFENPMWLEEYTVPVDGVPWEIHRIADRATRKIALEAWYAHQD